MAQVVDRTALARAVEAFLAALGRDPRREPELADTPKRVANAWADDLLDGYDVDVGALLEAESFAPHDLPEGPVLLTDLAVATICPHHLLPAHGTAAVLYFPGQKMVGFGALARLVDAWAHRLTFQETLGQQIAHSLVLHLGARGAACKLRLSHDCLALRGEKQKSARVVTLAVAGTLAAPGPDRELALALLHDTLVAKTVRPRTTLGAHSGAHSGAHPGAHSGAHSGAHPGAPKKRR